MPLRQLRGIEISFLSNAAIARVHRDFFDDPTPTDVITFPHGEILLGAGILAENALRFKQSIDDEAALCIIHGFMHLGGWDDLTTKEAKEMARAQEQIFKQARQMVGSGG